jgi:type III pantothenate kinase
MKLFIQRPEPQSKFPDKLPRVAGELARRFSVSVHKLRASSPATRQKIHAIVTVMDINVLVINVGNSRLALGAFVAGNLEYVKRIGNDQRSDWVAAIAEAWSHVSTHENAAVVGASVNPPLIETVEHAVMQATNQPVQWVGSQIDLPIKVLTENPKETGVDRVLNVAAAYEQMQKACIVVDAGTAITIDCCNDAGEFLGGTIAPGAKLMLDGLHQNTAKLPQAPLDVPREPIGRSTRSAIQAGVFYAIRGMVREVAENYATELGNWPEIIATGGDAAILFQNWELIHAIAPELTLYGIALAYTEHQIKHET